jgi:hypothetical protein
VAADVKERRFDQVVAKLRQVQIREALALRLRALRVVEVDPEIVEYSQDLASSYELESVTYSHTAGFYSEFDALLIGDEDLRSTRYAAHEAPADSMRALLFGW